MIYLKVFIVGIIEFFLGVVDFKLTQRSKMMLSAFCTVVGIYIWYFIIRTIIDNIDNFYLITSYAIGSGTGCYLALKADQKWLKPRKK